MKLGASTLWSGVRRAWEVASFRIYEGMAEFCEPGHLENEYGTPDRVPRDSREAEVLFRARHS